MNLNIPFKRALYPPDDPQGRGGATGTIGEDVLAVKIALSRAGYWPWQEFDDVYNNAFSHGKKPTVKIQSGVAGFQRDNNIKPTGFYGKATHDLLVAKKVPFGKPHVGEWVFDQRARYLYNGFLDTTPEQEALKRYYEWWDWAVRNEKNIGYSQNRPIYALFNRQDPIKLPALLDCSGTIIYATWLAGMISPDITWGHRGYGNTNSMNDGGFKIDIFEVDKYAKDYLVLAYYGPSVWDTRHVTSVKNSGEVYSMGRESAPEKFARIQYRDDWLECRAYKVL